jgi:hypothetical protein
MPRIHGYGELDWKDFDAKKLKLPEPPPSVALDPDEGEDVVSQYQAASLKILANEDDQEKIAWARQVWLSVSTEPIVSAEGWKQLTFNLLLDKTIRQRFVQQEWVCYDFVENDRPDFTFHHRPDSESGWERVDDSRQQLPRELSSACLTVAQQIKATFHYNWDQADFLELCFEDFAGKIKKPTRFIQALVRKINKAIKQQ